MSSVNLLKHELQKKSLSEKVFDYQKDQRVSQIKKAEADVAKDMK